MGRAYEQIDSTTMATFDNEFELEKENAVALTGYETCCS